MEAPDFVSFDGGWHPEFKLTPQKAATIMITLPSGENRVASELLFTLIMVSLTSTDTLTDFSKLTVSSFAPADRRIGDPAAYFEMVAQFASPVPAHRRAQTTEQEIPAS